jgi:hypothetical protein
MALIRENLASRFYLGKPCRRQKHLYEETDLCLRYKTNGGCVYCKGILNPGLPDFGEIGATKEEVFWAKVNKNIGMNKTCWEWTGKSLMSGYGRMRFNGSYKGTHRISWEISNGDIPKRLSVLHKCDNRLCVNPEHLFLGTQKDNMLDMISKGRSNPQQGDSHCHAKLKKDQVLLIRKRLAQGESQTALSHEFNVHQTTIYDIKAQRSWKHLTVAEVI